MASIKQILGLDDTDAIFEDLKTDAAAQAPEITNVNKTGGIFRAVLYLYALVTRRMYDAMEAVVAQAFVEYASGDFLDLHGAEMNCPRLDALHTEGPVRFTRAAGGGNINVPKGTVVATATDAQGRVYRYLTKAAAVIPDAAPYYLDIEAIAESPGRAYNAGLGNINVLVNPVSGVTAVSNNVSGWPSVEGRDKEADEAYRARIKLKWTQLAHGFTRGSYESVALDNGAVDVFVNDKKPRGEGTVDVLIIGETGLPVPGSLVTAVQNAIDAVKPATDDVEVKGPTGVAVDITVTITKHPFNGEESAVQTDVEGALDALFLASADYPDVSRLGVGDDVTRALIFKTCMRADVVNVAISAPAADTVIDYDEIATAGTITVNVVTGTL